MIAHNLGYPRIGDKRELKKAVEGYWSGTVTYKQLLEIGKDIKVKNWQIQQQVGIDLIPSNDFSFYDHILDMTLTVGAIPDRYRSMANFSDKDQLDLYFAMARGTQSNENDLIAMEMTKWFNTNYHYIVPEFIKDQKFKLNNLKFLHEFKEAKNIGIITKPVLIGPVSYLLLGKEKEEGFDRIDLINNLLPVYLEMVELLEREGVNWIQFDEPSLVTDLSAREREAFRKTYTEFHERFPKIKILISSYFGSIGNNSDLVASLPVDAIHLDLVNGKNELRSLLDKLPEKVLLSLGVVDGRNIWVNDFSNSLQLIKNVTNRLGKDRIMVAPSCSLLHVPCDLDLEINPNDELKRIKPWLSFAKQKIAEVVTIKNLANGNNNEDALLRYGYNQRIIIDRENSKIVHVDHVKDRIRQIMSSENRERGKFSDRKQQQKKQLGLPLFPTTTIGSFPQTSEIRKLRSKLKKGIIDQDQYEKQIRREIHNVVQLQEEIGLDVLVHGEFERNDMVEYFGEMLNGFAFTQNGWVQSYGTRCVKPPIIFGDVYRPAPMTIKWIKYAQFLTDKPVKGMLTGPVTILKWSFVRDDQPLKDTCMQIALSIRDEVLDLEKGNIKIIQIDEPALREGLPLRKEDWPEYLDWAVKAFRITYLGVDDATQIHTHMCYSEFDDIIGSIIAMDADVITIECSRSQMELLNSFVTIKYPNDIGPGLYDIHSPRVPFVKEIAGLIEKANNVLPKENLWINPDCGLKTRGWEETKGALRAMVDAAKEIRLNYQS